MSSDNSIKLLVVDDQSNYFNALAQVAEMCDHQFQIECKHSDSTTNALTLIDKWTPTVVIVDAHLTDSLSYDFVEKCKGGFTQIIVTSSDHSQEIQESALAH